MIREELNPNFEESARSGYKYITVDEDGWQALKIHKRVTRGKKMDSFLRNHKDRFDKAFTLVKTNPEQRSFRYLLPYGDEVTFFPMSNKLHLHRNNTWIRYGLAYLNKVYKNSNKE